MESSKVFNQFEAEIKSDRAQVLALAAEQLQKSVLAQAEKLNIKSGTKTYSFDSASYVNLSPLLSGLSERVTISGKPHLWVLLDTGKRLGFKRIGRGNTWRDLQARWGSRLFFANNIVFFRNTRDGKNYPIYKLEKQVQTSPKINFFGEAERIAEELGSRS